MFDDIRLEARSLGDLTSLVEDLVTAARRETLGALARDRFAENKGKSVFDPVTRADRACEVALRRLIEDRFPDHGIRGEEFPDKAAKCPFAWSIDPIDGTRSYMCELPSWTTLIALLENGEPVLGLIDAPCLDETYVGISDRAVMVRKGEVSSLSTSGCKRISKARFSTTDPFLFGPAKSALQLLIRKVQVTRYGHDGYAYARLAAGSLDLVVETGLKPHDYNAHLPVIRAAGGHIGDWAGGDDFAEGKIIAAASRELYEATVELLAAA